MADNNRLPIWMRGGSSSNRNVCPSKQPYGSGETDSHPQQTGGSKQQQQPSGGSTASSNTKRRNSSQKHGRNNASRPQTQIRSWSSVVASNVQPPIPPQQPSASDAAGSNTQSLNSSPMHDGHNASRSQTQIRSWSSVVASNVQPPVPPQQPRASKAAGFNAQRLNASQKHGGNNGSRSQTQWCTVVGSNVQSPVIPQQPRASEAAGFNAQRLNASQKHGGNNGSRSQTHWCTVVGSNVQPPVAPQQSRASKAAGFNAQRLNASQKHGGNNGSRSQTHWCTAVGSKVQPPVPPQQPSASAAAGCNKQCLNLLQQPGVQHQISLQQASDSGSTYDTQRPNQPQQQSSFESHCLPEQPNGSGSLNLQNSSSPQQPMECDGNPPKRRRTIQVPRIEVDVAVDLGNILDEGSNMELVRDLIVDDLLLEGEDESEEDDRFDMNDDDVRWADEEQMIDYEMFE